MTVYYKKINELLCTCAYYPQLYMYITCVSSWAKMLLMASHFHRESHLEAIHQPLLRKVTLLQLNVTKLQRRDTHVGADIKVAEHSFRARFCWCKLACAQGCQKTNMPSTEWSFYLLNTRTICVIFLYNFIQCIDGSSILLQRYVTKGNDAKNPAF